MKFRFTKFFPLLLLGLSVIWMENCRPSSLLDKAPNYVFLITLDTLRADYVSCYPQAKAHTPSLEEFARQGIVIDPAYSPIPITAPAHAIIFYSLSPHDLKLYNNGQVFKQPAEKTSSPASLSQIFRQHHFTTAAFISLGVLKAKFGLARGFDYYADDFPASRWYLTAEEINQRFFAWLDEFKAQKAFVWLHYSDPHDPYAPPSTPPDIELVLNQSEKKKFSLQKMEPLQATFKARRGRNVVKINVLFPHPEGKIRVRLSQIKVSTRQGRDLPISIRSFDVYTKEGKKYWLIQNDALLSFHNPGPAQEVQFQARGEIFLTNEEKRKAYQQEVEYLDAQLKVLREGLISRGIFKQSLFILVGDHGEGLGERRTRFGDFHFGHIHFLYNNYLRVPFIISSPALKKTFRVENKVASLLDVAPTLLHLLGWDKPAFYRGRNILKTRKSGSPGYVFLETYRPEASQDRFGGLLFPWHLIFTPENGRFELFNLNQDPLERNNLHSSQLNSPELRTLYRRVTTTALKILEEKEETVLDPQAREMLRSLGYIK
ncbi:sulfatase-like hydrolase/transferase [Candidatus Aminicenantes bacterium AC-334-K16]|jgi:arylsulfatase A-like enzyme|nr:sulfatase-like hydrolase/transferase [Candidatus Aminicenantes bacterium AC-334-K16]